MYSRVLRALFAACALSVALVPGISQTFSVLSVDTSNFPVMKARFYAFDAAGNQAGPAAPDITVTEDGTARTVVSVSCPAIAAPANISSLLVIDVSGSMSTLAKAGLPDTRMDLAKAAATSWVQALALGPSECAITTFDHANYYNQDFTTDRQLLLDAIAPLQPQGGTDYDMGLLNPVAGGLQVTPNAKHKRVIVFLSDGLPNQSPSVSSIVAEANRQNCIIFAVTLGMPCPQSLRDICNQTGGEWFENVTTVVEARDVYNKILHRAQSAGQCTMTWQSVPACGANKRTVTFSWYGVTVQAAYNIPGRGIASLRASPALLLLRSKPPGVRFDTTITLTASNGGFTVMDIASSNPAFAVSPKNFAIADGQSRTLTVSFTPADSGYALTQFDATTNLCVQSFSAAGGYPGMKSRSPSIRVVAPNGGEIFVAGSDTVITWTGVPLASSVRLEYSADNGIMWKTIADSVAGGSYSWRVPREVSKTCLVRISLH